MAIFLLLSRFPVSEILSLFSLLSDVADQCEVDTAHGIAVLPPLDPSLLGAVR